MCVYDYSDVTLTVYYLKNLVYTFAHAGRKNAGMNNGRYGAGKSVQDHVRVYSHFGRSLSYILILRLLRLDLTHIAVS